VTRSPSFPPRNADFEARTRDSFARQGFMRTADAQLTIVRPGYVEITVPRHEKLLQQHGYFHGGVIGAIADTSGGYACFTLMAATDTTLTIE